MASPRAPGPDEPVDPAPAQAPVEAAAPPTDTRAPATGARAPAPDARAPAPDARAPAPDARAPAPGAPTPPPATDAAQEPPAVARAMRAAAKFDRRAVSIGAGLLAAIPVAALMGGGLLVGNRVAAVTMGAGAMLVGIAWRITGGRPPLALMATDACLMGLSTFVGCVTGAYAWAHVLILCLWSLIGGLLVSLGGRGALLGTQSIIAVVVFGRFSQSAGQSLGLAAYVLTGGLAQVTFLSVVRWPTPLRWQREATAAAYRELARVAAGATQGATLQAAAALDAAQAALAPGSLFGDSALMTLRSLVNEGLRMRVQLTAILSLIDRARAQSVGPLPALADVTESALSATAAALKAAARAITAESGAHQELQTRVAAVSTRAERAAELAGLTPGGTRELHLPDRNEDAPDRDEDAPDRDEDAPDRDEHAPDRDEDAPDRDRPAPDGDQNEPPGCRTDPGHHAESGHGRHEPVPHLALSTQLVRRLAALAGQLRAVETLAPAAGRGGGLRSRRPHRRANRPIARLRDDLALMRANASLRSPAGRHALRLAIVVPLAELLARELPLHRGYWVVVAAATVLRPEFGATLTRGTERALGTSLGVALAGAIVVLLQPAGGATVVIVGLLAWAGYAVFPASFAVGFAFITTLTVFLLNAISPDTLSTAAARLLDTAVGSVLGLIVFALWPTWSRRPARHALAELTAAQREYIGSVLTALIHGRRASEDEVRRGSRRARMARTTAEDTVAKSLSDPATRRIDAEWTQGLLASMRRLVQAAHVLRLDVQDNRNRAAMPGLDELAGRLDELLHQVQLRIEPGSTPAPDSDPPDLRGAFSHFAGQAPRSTDALALLSELDEVVDAAGGLASLVGLDPADPPERPEKTEAPRPAEAAPG